MIRPTQPDKNYYIFPLRLHKDIVERINAFALANGIPTRNKAIETLLISATSTETP